MSHETKVDELRNFYRHMVAMMKMMK